MTAPSADALAQAAHERMRREGVVLQTWGQRWRVLGPADIQRTRAVALEIAAWLREQDGGDVFAEWIEAAMR